MASLGDGRNRVLLGVVLCVLQVVTGLVGFTSAMPGSGELPQSGIAALPSDPGVFGFRLAQAASPASSLPAAPSNVCVTVSTACGVTPGTTRGAPCQCFVPPATWVPGVAEYHVDVPSEIQ
jgi:hypothetical protein